MKLIKLFAISLAVLALGACGKQDDSTAMEQTTDTVKESAIGAMETTRDATGKAIEKSGEKVEEAGKAMRDSGESMQQPE